MWDKTIVLKKNSTKISYIFISLSLIFWIYYLLNSKMIIGSLGLFNGIHPFFFISTAILILSMLITISFNIKNKYLLLLHYSLITLFFWSINISIEKTPRFVFQYLNFGYIDSILNTGYVDSDRISYLIWPGSHILAAFIIQLSNLDIFNFITLSPQILNIFLFPVYYLLFKLLLQNEKEIWICLAFNSVSFLGTGYYLPGSFGAYCILLVIIVLLLLDYKNNNLSRYNIIIVLLLLALINYHLLSSFELMILIMVFYAGKKIYFRMLKETFLSEKISFSSNSPMSEKISFPLNSVMLLGVLIAARHFYLYYRWTSQNFATFFGRLFDVADTIQSSYVLGYSGSVEHSMVVNIRILFVLIIIALSMSGFGISLYSLYKRKHRNLFVEFIPVIWIFGCLITAFSIPYTGEALTRAFGYSTLPLYVLIAKNIRSKKTFAILAILMLIFPVLSIICAYGNEQDDYVPLSEIRGVEFLHYTSSNHSNVAIIKERVWPLIDDQKLELRTFELDDFYKKPYQYASYNKREIEGYNFILGDLNSTKLLSFCESNINNKIYGNSIVNLYERVKE
jgi:hypothetical protein